MTKDHVLDFYCILIVYKSNLAAVIRFTAALQEELNTLPEFLSYEDRRVVSSIVMLNYSHYIDTSCKDVSELAVLYNC